MRVKRPDDDHRQDAENKDHRWQHQQPRRLADPEHVHAREHGEPDQRDQEEMMREPWENAPEARGSRRKAHRDGQHVVDDHCCRRQQTRPAAEVGLRHRIGAAPLRVSLDHL